MHRRHLAVACTLVLALAAGPALAQTNAAGIALRWDTCFGEGGLDNKVFACDTNSGSETLVATYRVGQALAQVCGNEILLDLASASPSVPAWWQFKNSGTCRQTALSMNFTGDPAWVECTDAWQGQASGGIGAYTVGYAGSNTARLTAAVAIPTGAAFTADPGVEYFSCNVVITNRSTVGTGACAGCLTPMCLDLENIKLTTPNSANDVSLWDGAPWSSSKLCVWQSGTFATYDHRSPSDCSPTDPNCYLYLGDTFTCAVADPTPTKAHTWGMIKTLYR